MKLHITFEVLENVYSVPWVAAIFWLLVIDMELLQYTGLPYCQPPTLPITLYTCGACVVLWHSFAR